MIDNDNSNPCSRQDVRQSQECCPSTSDGGACCSPGAGGRPEKWRAVIFVVVLTAAGIVLARSLVRRSNAAAEQPQQTFPTIETAQTAETTAHTETQAKEQTAERAEPTLWGPELNSLASLDDVATDVDTVFILICAEDQQNGQAIAGAIESATKKIRSRGKRASAFRLKTDATDYENLAEQFSVPTVLAMVKGCGYSAVSEQITETNLLEAYVAASRPQAGCCPPGTDPSQCDPAGCAPSDSQ